MQILLDGKKVRDFHKHNLAVRIGALAVKGIRPRLAIIQIGDDSQSAIYIEQKKKFGASIGAMVDHIKLGANVSIDDVAERIESLNEDPSIHGIIVQMPVPAHLDRLAIMNLVRPSKDVDGLTDENQKLLEDAVSGKGEPGLVPATGKGVMALLDFYDISVKDKNAVVIGRSRLVGHPIAELLKMRGAKVTVCHSKTEDIPSKARTADIIVVAVGKAHMVDASYIGNKETVVIDVGINPVSVDLPLIEGTKRKITGDVDFETVSPLVRAISPVPGGVGPMTVTSLFDNLVWSAENL